VKGNNLEKIIQCTEMHEDHTINFSVSECSNYDSKATPALYEMRQIAWNIETKPKNKAGFTAGVATKGDDGTLDIVISPPRKRDPDGQPIDE
jgi:hypothetical protein